MPLVIVGLNFGRQMVEQLAGAAGRAETWTHYREEADGNWYDDPDRAPSPRSSAWEST